MPRWGRFWSSSHRATFLRFALVAVTIALLDAGVLYGLHAALGVNVYIARVPSYLAAMTAGYFLNRRYTFHQHERFRSILADLLRFYAVFAGGGVLNYAVFAAVVALGQAAGLAPAVTFWLPLLGVWVGGLVGMAFNYLFSHKLVFQG